MMHPEGMYLVNTAGLALDPVEFEYRGRAAHAAGTPYEGINALDAVIQLFNGINALRQQLRADARIHGIITEGGTYPNITPDHTVAKLYVRAMERAYCTEVTRKVINCARGAATATGCKLTVKRFERSYDNVVNNPVLARLVTESLHSLGIHDLAESDPVPGSSDFGNLSHRVPSLYVYCATAPKDSVLHTKEFARLSIARRAHEHTIIVAKAMALAGLEILSDHTLAKQLRDSFVG